MTQQEQHIKLVEIMRTLLANLSITKEELFPEEEDMPVISVPNVNKEGSILESLKQVKFFGETQQQSVNDLVDFVDVDDQDDDVKGFNL